MERPTWATTVGILGIIFGCFGILGAGQEIFMPKILKMQKEMFTKMQEAPAQQKAKANPENCTEEKNNKSVKPVFPPAMSETMQKMFDVPDWFGAWSIFSGVAKALVSAIYLLASIWLLQLKPTSIKLFYWAAGSSVCLCVLKGVVSVAALSFMGIAMMFGGAFGALIDIVLIIVVATGNKAAFQLKPAVESSRIDNT